MGEECKDGKEEEVENKILDCKMKMKKKIERV